MNPITRALTLLLPLALLAGAGVGCTTTYDGSTQFNEMHPEYQHTPGYMSPDGTTNLPDNQPQQ